MTKELKYFAEDFTRTVPAEYYINNFRDREKFLESCRECGNYGRSWGCPPFDFDTDALLAQYSKVLLVATKIYPQQHDLPIGASQQLIRPERIRLERRLLELEQHSGGRAFAYIGTCLHCQSDSCTRISELPCRHPDLVRPSLEAFGFDISRTVSELFGIQLLWESDGLIPEYLTLVCGLFHDGEDLKF